MLVGSLTAERMESEGTDFGNPDIVKYAESLEGVGAYGRPNGRVTAKPETCFSRRAADFVRWVKVGRNLGAKPPFYRPPIASEEEYSILLFRMHFC
jgi:hypothetical protein